MRAFESLISSECYIKIATDIEIYVSDMLNGYKPNSVRAKTIHDPVWGSIEYSEWEMQIIDSPLFQRLRDINQVGLAMLTYPAARHSRFEHSLGVLAATKKICEKIQNNSKSFNFPVEDRNSVCLAALLHDIGHSFYSHLSEKIYGEFPDFLALIDEFNAKLERNPKPHEIVSFIIINTAAFKNFFFEKINYPNKNQCKAYLFQDVSKIIVGAYIEKNYVLHSYLTAIVNGPFDSDKLDYIKRDSFTAGLSLAYDMERLFSKIVVHTISNGNKVEHRLAINVNGITAIEELTFCRIMLFSYIYYHQKVLISETMIKDYVQGLHRLGIIQSIADFLKYTDSDILSLADKQNGRNPFPEYPMLDLKMLSENIKYRRLPKRCFEVSQTYIESTKPNDLPTLLRSKAVDIITKSRNEATTVDEIEKDILGFLSVVMKEDPVSLDALISDYIDLKYDDLLKKRFEFYNAIVEEYKSKGKSVDFTLFDVYIVFPKQVNYGSEAAGEGIVLGKDKTTLLAIKDFVKLTDWAASFNSNKWKGYVFVSEKVDSDIAFKVAESLILKGKAKLKNPFAYLNISMYD
ncbi:MAG: HD domain-containing protein [Firmicutes bacterium]|nr:HD domain-containing protein [Bacillota bacterium]